MNPAKALKALDEKWWSRQHPRRMDVFGDFAGEDFFLIDGESMLQEIFEDPLVSIGKGTLGFQILHILYSVEKFMERLKNQSPNFEVIFFESNTSTSNPLPVGSVTSFDFSSRFLASKIVIQHLKTIAIPIRHFSHPGGHAYREYTQAKRPYFILMNDGGVHSSRHHKLGIQTTFLQRALVYLHLSRGIAVVTMSSCDYRDAKLLAFVYERTSRVLQEEGTMIMASMQHSASSLIKLHRAALKDIGGTTEPKVFSSVDSWMSDTVLEVAEQFCTSDRLLHLSVLRVWLAHTSILPHIHMSARSQALQTLPQALDSVCREVLPKLFVKLAHSLPVDILPAPFDGHIFLFLMHHSFVLRSDLSELLGQALFSRLQALFAPLSADGSISILDFPINTPPSTSIVASRAPKMSKRVEAAPFKLYPFTNQEINQHLERVKVETSPGRRLLSGAVDFAANSIFVDERHWHNRAMILPKHLGGADPQAVTAWQKRKRLIQQQRFMKRLKRQAESLLGGKGAVVKTITIEPVGTKPVARNAAHQAKKTWSSKGKQPTKKELMLASIKESKAIKTSAEAEVWWDQVVGETNSLSSIFLRLEQVERLMNTNERTRDGWLSVHIRVFKIHLLLSLWIEDRTRELPSTKDRFSVSILRAIQDIQERAPHASSNAIKAIVSTLIALGLISLEALIPSDSGMVKQPLGFQFVKIVRKQGAPVYPWMTIEETPVRWQLRLFGEYLDRSFDSRPDPRVTFHPDAWQREVLDKLDRNESILVVAPTSAGKTFISFYAMEKVLRQGDNTVILYIAPTKALVTQIAAEVVARFKKDLRSGSCWAIHTRDQRINNPQGCQILITVPEMAAIMLLSPPLAQTWTPRIKRIILDEIHSIGQQEGGAVWEQLLLLAPCPIIGLSATVGKADVFNEWLSSVQATHGFQHSMVVHKHRYSHLRKFSYQMQSTTPVFKGISAAPVSNNIRFLHPIALLSPGTKSLPSDLAFESRDCLTLYNALRRTAGSSRVKHLAPEKVFAAQAGRLLTNREVIDYEGKLKEFVEGELSLDGADDPESVISRTITALGRDADLSHLEDPLPEQFKANLLPFILELHKNNELPGLFFSFDRTRCELMGEHICDQLASAEKTFKEKDAAWQQKIKAWEQWKAQAKERERAAAREKRNTGKLTADLELRTQSENPNERWENFNPNAPLDDFSFLNMKAPYSIQELFQDCKEIMWVGTPTWAVVCLQRGIGVHHSGMNKAYRALLEMLFRIGFIRVVFATGGLALGINMPARTVAFCGDSAFLTALMYRQCAGRAGRRGFDLLGKVVFYGLPEARVKQLAMSRLPPLTGHFPLTSTLTLRLMNLLSGSKYSPTALNAIRSILRLPRLVVGSEASHEEVLHHLRFSIDYLIRLRLLDEGGHPLNPWFPLVAHLYHTEPSNLALVALFQAGVIHDICDADSMTAQRSLMHLLSHLFGRIFVPKAFRARVEAGEFAKLPSMVTLPPLPPAAVRVLRQHNHEVLRIFAGYAFTYASQHASRLPMDDQLPLSGFRIAAAPDEEHHPILDRLEAQKVPITVRSAFVANSGHGDNFGTVSELVQSSRPGVHLNKHSIPSFDGLVDRGEELLLNAYLLDFWIHGQKQTIVKANGIREGSFWYLLSDFALTLQTIVVTLESLIRNAAMSKAEKESPSGDASGTLGDWDAYVVEEESPTGNADEEAKNEAQAELDISTGNAIDRPPGVTDRDWRVYLTFVAVQNEFIAKFRPTYA